MDDSITTSVTSGFGQVQDLLVTTVAPAVFTLAVAAIAITYGIKWLRKGTSKG